MDRVVQYAESVIGGSIDRPAGQSETSACQRFMHDLERQGTDEFPFIYDERRAARMIEFSEQLTLAEGDEPQPFRPWGFQCFIMGNWNGWVHQTEGNRRFRTSYIQMGRQNGKSVMNSIPSLYYGNFDGYRYPQIYCVATKELQARIVLKECSKFIESDNGLSGTKAKKGLFTIQDYKSQILCNLTRGSIKALGRDTESIDGFRPYFASVDEYHKHKTNQMYKLLTDGDKKMKSCLVSIITTAGFDLNCPCKGEYDYARNILRGFSDETHFVFICEPDQSDREGDRIWREDVWPKAHPLWTPETLVSMRSDAVKAREKGGDDLLNFKTKNLNIWVQATDAQYLNDEKWTKSASATTLADMRGRSCYMGLDLSSGGDLTSDAFEFPLDDGRYFIDSHSYMPSARLLEHEQTDKAPYRVWVGQGLLTLTETLGGYKTDYKYILARCRKLIKEYDLHLLGIAYDPHNADAFLSDLDEFGCDLVSVAPSARNLNDATVDFKTCVDAGYIVRDRQNTMLEWSFRNAVTVHNSFGEIKIDKDFRRKRIDPCDAVINAHKLAMTIETRFDAGQYNDEFFKKWWGV